MLGRTDSRGRHLLLLGPFAFLAIALVARLAWWQGVRRDDLAAQARQQTSLRIEIAGQRGAIYDRSGTVALATTVERDRIIAATSDLTSDERHAISAELTSVLELDATESAAVAAKLAERRPYVVLERGLDQAASDRVQAAIDAGRLPHV